MKRNRSVGFSLLGRDGKEVVIGSQVRTAASLWDVVIDLPSLGPTYEPVFLLDCSNRRSNSGAIANGICPFEGFVVKLF